MARQMPTLISASRLFLRLSLLGMTLFMLNLGLGKLALLYQWKLWLHLEGVAEFLLMLSNIICFVIGTLLNERRTIIEKTNRTEEENRT